MLASQMIDDCTSLTLWKLPVFFVFVLTKSGRGNTIEIACPVVMMFFDDVIIMLSLCEAGHYRAMHYVGRDAYELLITLIFRI